jgi:hypothetical protein
VLRRRGHVHLKGKLAVLLQQPIVDVLNRLEPRQPGVVNVVGLVMSTANSSMSRTIIPKSTFDSVVPPVGRGPRKQSIVFSSSADGGTSFPAYTR